jgi:Holliday junction resolvasome RuvABC DNA-binding subunit
MRGLSEREKKILQLKRKQLSGYRIGRELGMDPPHVYRSLKIGKKKLRKFLKDLEELGVSPTEIEKFLKQVEEEETETKEASLRAAY